MNHMEYMFQDLPFYCTKKVPKNHNHFFHFRHGGGTHFLVLAQTLIYFTGGYVMNSSSPGQCNYLSSLALTQGPVVIVPSTATASLWPFCPVLLIRSALVLSLTHKGRATNNSIKPKTHFKLFQICFTQCPYVYIQFCFLLTW